MVVTSYKKCDCCGKEVATKGMLLWHTTNDYVTIRGDKPDMDFRTIKHNWHICLPCWFEIVNSAREKLKKG